MVTYKLNDKATCINWLGNRVARCKTRLNAYIIFNGSNYPGQFRDILDYRVHLCRSFWINGQGDGFYTFRIFDLNDIWAD